MPKPSRRERQPSKWTERVSRNLRTETTCSGSTCVFTLLAQIKKRCGRSKSSTPVSKSRLDGSNCELPIMPPSLTISCLPHKTLHRSICCRPAASGLAYIESSASICKPEREKEEGEEEGGRSRSVNSQAAQVESLSGFTVRVYVCVCVSIHLFSEKVRLEIHKEPPQIGLRFSLLDARRPPFHKCP